MNTDLFGDRFCDVAVSTDFFGDPPASMDRICDDSASADFFDDPAASTDRFCDVAASADFLGNHTKFLNKTSTFNRDFLKFSEPGGLTEPVRLIEW